MRSKTLNLNPFALATTLALFSGAAALGGADREGNGGGFLVCRGPDHTILKAVSYDLWRGSAEKFRIGQKKLTVDVRRHSETSAKDQAIAASEKIKRYNSIFYRKYFRPILDEMIVRIDAARTQKVTTRPATKQDFDPRVFPDGSFCPDGVTPPEYETAILYTDSGPLGSNPEYMSKHIQIIEDYKKEGHKEANFSSKEFQAYYVERINTELFEGKPVIQNPCDGRWFGPLLGCWPPYNQTVAEALKEANDSMDFAIKHDPKSRLSSWHPAEFYFDEMDVSPEILNKTETETDLGAVYLHETAYKYVRLRFQEASADRVNRLVTVLMSDLPKNEVNVVLKEFIDPLDEKAVSTHLTNQILTAKTVEEAKTLAESFEYSQDHRVSPYLTEPYHWAVAFWSSNVFTGHHEGKHEFTLLLKAGFELNVAVVKYLVEVAKIDPKQSVTWASFLDYDRKLHIQELLKDMKAKTPEQKKLKAEILALVGA